MWVIAVGFLHLSTEENLNNVKQFASSEYDAESFVEKKKTQKTCLPAWLQHANQSFSVK